LSSERRGALRSGTGSQSLERHRLDTVVAIDFEDDIALSLGLLTGGVSGLGFHHYPPQGSDNRPSVLMALALRRVTHWSTFPFGSSCIGLAEVFHATRTVPAEGTTHRAPIGNSQYGNSVCWGWSGWGDPRRSLRPSSLYPPTMHRTSRVRRISSMVECWARKAIEEQARCQRHRKILDKS